MTAKYCSTACLSEEIHVRSGDAEARDGRDQTATPCRGADRTRSTIMRKKGYEIEGRNVFEDLGVPPFGALTIVSLDEVAQSVMGNHPTGKRIAPGADS